VFSIGLSRSCGLIVVADDDDRYRRYVSRLLAQAGYRAELTCSGEEALDAVRTQRPAAVLLDVCLPVLSGYEVCHLLREELGQQLPIVFVSGVRKESFDRVAGLLLGADDYVIKPFAPDEFLARVSTQVRRSAAFSSAQGASLTPREHEVLRCLADGLEQTEIARALVISPKTVGTHVEHILSKLGVRSRAQAVARAYRDSLIRLLV
jgi:DNA-binding NarL/FixJ family response regulator